MSPEIGQDLDLMPSTVAKFPLSSFGTSPLLSGPFDSPFFLAPELLHFCLSECRQEICAAFDMIADNDNGNSSTSNVYTERNNK